MRAAPAPTVLVVDDEELLLELITRVLERAGWRVACARDGEQALALFAAEPDRFQAAILDVGLPPAGAVDVLRRLRALRPGLGAILTSGNGPDPGVREALREGRSAFVAKPFAPRDLTRALAQVHGESA